MWRWVGRDQSGLRKGNGIVDGELRRTARIEETYFCFHYQCLINISYTLHPLKRKIKISQQQASNPTHA